MTVFADAAFNAGIDDIAGLDDNDEVVMLASDSWTQRASTASPPAAPPGTEPASRVDVKIVDPLNPSAAGYIALFKWAGSDSPPAASNNPVSYTFTPLGEPSTPWQGNTIRTPENSTVETSTYQLHFSARWVVDSLKIKAAGREQTDILDRQRLLILEPNSPDNLRKACYGTEDTLSSNNSAWVTQKSGPLRGIRAGFLTFSGHYVYHEWIFTPNQMIENSVVVGHANPGHAFVFDFVPGSVASSSLDSSTAIIDGTPDPAMPQYAWGAPQTGGSPPVGMKWFAVDGGSQGGLVMVTDYEDASGIEVGRYYRDDADTDITGMEQPCQPTYPPTPATGYTGDGQDYGVIGLTYRGWEAGVSGWTKNTYPELPLCPNWYWCYDDHPLRQPYQLRYATYFSTGGMSSQQVTAQVAAHDNPLQATVLP